MAKIYAFKCDGPGCLVTKTPAPDSVNKRGPAGWIELFVQVIEDPKEHKNDPSVMVIQRKAPRLIFHSVECMMEYLPTKFTDALPPSGDQLAPVTE